MRTAFTSVSFDSKDTVDARLCKASEVIPSPEQLKWLKKEMTAFIHFGPNTFTGRQWGTGKETLADYVPTALDPAQWVRVCKEAGLKHVICTLKHHDGFCLWDTKTTDFNVMNSACPVDVAKALSDACHEEGIGFGVYLSPWDMHQREAGLWGTDAYNDYFLAQLEELLTNYGDVEEVWFDGACGDYAIWQQVPCYKPETWYAMIHRLAPNAVYRMYDPYFFAEEGDWESVTRGEKPFIWDKKAIRWVGNEEGRSRRDEWAVQPIFSRAIAESATFPDLGEEHYYENAVGAFFYPVEVNTTLLNQWFHNPETSRVKTLAQLMETYRQSVGNGGVLLLNLSPDRTGRIPEDQINRLKEFRTCMDETYSRDLLAESTAVVNADANTFTYSLPAPASFDRILLEEDLTKGQHVREWCFEAFLDGAWKELAHKGAIGHRCIETFEKRTAKKVRLRILRTYCTPELTRVALFLGPDLSSFSSSDNAVPFIKDLQPEVNIGARPVVDGSGLGLCYEFKHKGRQTALSIAQENFIPESSGRIELPSVPQNSPYPAFPLEQLPAENDYAVRFTGMLEVKEDGIFRVELTSADGSALCIGQKLCILNDEPHEVRSACCDLMLKKGYYPVTILYTCFRNPAFLKIEFDKDREWKRIFILH